MYVAQFHGSPSPAKPTNRSQPKSDQTATSELGDCQDQGNLVRATGAHVYCITDQETLLRSCLAHDWRRLSPSPIPQPGRRKCGAYRGKQSTRDIRLTCLCTVTGIERSYGSITVHEVYLQNNKAIIYSKIVHHAHRV